MQALPAVDKGLLVQTDTYFRAKHGRLKLRETEGHAAELIWYSRANETAGRISDYLLLGAPQPELLKQALAAALGIRGEVRKSRQLYLWHNVRIHLDEVQQLGSFIEFEAVTTDPAQEPIAHQRLAHLWHALELRDEDRIAVSYSDLLGL